MEYAISRAYEVQRLAPDQLFALQTDETKKGRAFMPHEIQAIFNLPDLKVSYEIPDLEPSQALHAQRVRNEFFKQLLFPTYQHLGALNVERVHEFDDAFKNTVIYFTYSGGPNKKKLRDSLDDESTYSKTEKIHLGSKEIS